MAWPRRSRCMRRARGIWVGIGLLLALGVAPALAQGYPPGLAVPIAFADLGSHAIGDSFGARLCGPWTPGSIVTFTYNGRPAGSKPVQADGCVNATVVIASNNAVNVDDVLPGVCGRHNLVVTGMPDPRATNAISQATLTFIIDCNRVSNAVNPFLYP